MLKLKLLVQVKEIGVQQQRLVLEVNLEGGGLLGSSVLEMMVDVVVIVVVEIQTRRLKLKLRTSLPRCSH